VNNKAVFFDRDGIINVEKNYVYKIVDFEFINGIFELMQFFINDGYKIIVITNQAGIARGFYTEDDFNILTKWMCEKFSQKGIQITKVYYDPYHPDGIGEYKKESFNRKPNPGMILQAKKDFNLDLEKCILIGDKESDIKAGVNAGIKDNILISANCKDIYIKYLKR